MKHLLTGFPKVFSFTVHMTTGSQSWKRTTVAFVLVLFLIPVIILSLVTALDDSAEEMTFTGSLTTLYTVDETDGEVDYSLLTATDSEQILTALKVIPCENLEEAKTQLHENAMILSVTKSENTFMADLITADDTAVTDGDIDYIADFFGNRFHEVLVLKSGLSTEEMMTLMMPITVHTLGDAPEDDGDMPISDEEAYFKESIKEAIGFVVPYVTVMFLYFFVLFYGQSAAQLIVMEKTSKLMDTVLVSVRPAAMIFGKITANFCCAVIQLFTWLLSLLLGVLAGFAAAGAIDPVRAPKLSDITDTLALLDGMFSPVSALLAIVLMLAGCILYTSLASIGGALAGKQEDLQSTNVLFTMALVVSFMVVVFGGNLFETGQMAQAPWMNFIPFTAVLITPSQILMGNVSALIGFVSLLLTLAFSAVVLLIAGKIYGMMSFYRGNPPKVMQILGLLNGKRRY